MKYKKNKNNNNIKQNQKQYTYSVKKLIAKNLFHMQYQKEYQKDPEKIMLKEYYMTDFKLPK